MLFIKIEYKKKTWHAYSTYCRNLLETIFAYIEQSSLIPNSAPEHATDKIQKDQNPADRAKKLKLSVNRFISLSLSKI